MASARVIDCPVKVYDTDGGRTSWRGYVDRPGGDLKPRMPNWGSVEDFSHVYHGGPAEGLEPAFAPLKPPENFREETSQVRRRV